MKYFKIKLYIIVFFESNVVFFIGAVTLKHEFVIDDIVIVLF